MSRKASISFFCFVLACAGSCLWKLHCDARLENIRMEARDKIEALARDRIMAETGRVVFALQEIRRGELISVKSLEERKIPVSKMPDHAATDIDKVASCRARFGITKGDIVSLYDLDPYPPDLPVTAVLAVKNIRKGAVIMDDAVETLTQADEDLPKSRLERINLAIGRRATRDISKMQILRVEDVFP